MAALLDVIGVVSGILGIIQFGMDNFAEPDGASSVVKITVGLDVDNGLQNAGGSLPDVRLFNEAGGFLGINADGDGITSGNTGEINVSHQSGDGQQAAYALFSANDDAICIAYVSITWPNGDQYGWVADWGEQCGATWYYSNVYVQSGGRKPNCMWIDKDGDQPQTGFQVHFPEFVQKDGEDAIADKTTDYFCNAGPPFKYYFDEDPRGITNWVISKRGEKAVSYAPPNSNAGWQAKSVRHINYRRGNGTAETQPAQAKHSNRLVVDNDPEHSVTHLCESEGSVGPDFLNIADGQFCRMSDKTVWPVCTGDVQDNCFSVESQQLIVGGIATRDSPYGNVVDWTTGN
ncbi:Fc.00g041680.m01.CDS01 [Cosmosporella sp. VM-42]